MNIIYLSVLRTFILRDLSYCYLSENKLTKLGVLSKSI